MSLVHLYRICRLILFWSAFLTTFISYCKDVPASESVHLSIEPGFEGQYKKGGTVPVKVILENKAGETVNGEIKVLGGKIEYTFPVRLPPYSRKMEWISVHLEDISPFILFYSDKGIYLRKEVPLRHSIQNKGFVVYISHDHGRLHSLKKVIGESYQLFRVGPYDLWDFWEGYEQADFVLLDASVSEVMNGAQWVALKRYVLAGGILYVAGGTNHDFYTYTPLKELLQPPLRTDEQGNLLHKVKGVPFWSEKRVGMGHMFLLSFDSADEDFHPWMKRQNEIIVRHAQERDSSRLDILSRIPVNSWSKESNSILLNLIKWNMGYLLLLIPLGFLGILGKRKFFWIGFAILLLAGSFSSLGMLNGKNRLKGTTLITIYHGEEESLLQSRLSVLPVRGKKVYAKFDPKQILSFDSAMLGYKSFAWDRFEKLGPVLDVNLRAQHGKIKGIIKNLSEYPIENPSILVDGLFSPLQPIKGGEEVSIEIYHSV